MRTDLFDYDLPTELIAQTPTPRGESRMLVLHRKTGRIEHRRFANLPEYMGAGDVLVRNDTRVTARRLRGVRETGQDAEVLLLKPTGDRSWEALVKPARPLRVGRTLQVCGNNGEIRMARVTEITPEGGRILEFATAEERDSLESWGVAPLPPYIHTPLAAAEEERYQTVYARHNGSAAAPTAGLHFTPDILTGLTERGIQIAEVTLHVGVGTFRPVRTEEIEAHEMHEETAHLTTEAARIINQAAGRIFAVGTTSVRVLETAAAYARGNNASVSNKLPRSVAPFSGETRLFIAPGYPFAAVDAMITNFHLPRSTLLMLVSAFAGLETTRRAYEEAIRCRYRFFSFGDAMLIV